MNTVFFEIGGNEGNRLQNIELAKHHIETNVGKILDQSLIFETPPWGFSSTNNFYNQTLKVSTQLSLVDIFPVIMQIEQQLGRVRNSKEYASRTMDIDVLFFNDAIYNSGGIIVPHPRLHLRKFVLVPLADIAADFIHPVFDKSIFELLQECTDNANCVAINENS